MESSPHKKIVDVDTGSIRVSSEPAILQAVALGSCVAVLVCERNKKIGGLAHVMLPGKSPSMEKNTKYAEDAIRTLLDDVSELGAELEDLEISLVGGANVLQEGDIPDIVIESVLDYLKQLRLELHCMRVGGIARRSVFLDTTSSRIYYTEGDNTTKTLLNNLERL